MSKELSFEQANKQLEDIVTRMEKGDVELSECMKLYEEAYKLITYCTHKLTECKGQIADINERIENMKKSPENLFED